MSFPTDIRNCMRDCILSIFWPKKDIVTFFENCGCTKDDLKSVANLSEEGLSRARIIDAVFERLTARIGYWIDTEHAYYTYHPSYVESVWWHLKQLFDRGLLYEDFKVVPYCPRCETGLSSHELGQPGVYTDESDESVYVRFQLTDASARDDLGGATHLAVWTTTPWTLISNVAVAVNPEVTYAVVDGTVVAQELVTAVFGEHATASATFPGSRLLGLHYERPFDDVPLPDGVDALRRGSALAQHLGIPGQLRNELQLACRKCVGPEELAPVQSKY